MSEQREIKFRAWHKKHGMIYPDEYFTLQDAIIGNLDFFGSPAKDYNIADFVFMQFTGLKDLQGNEGYAGDLVLMFGRSIFSIVWDDYYARFQLELVKGNEITKIYDMGMLQYGVIVGNKYENPDILEESEA